MLRLLLVLVRELLGLYLVLVGVVEGLSLVRVLHLSDLVFSLDLLEASLLFDFPGLAKILNSLVQV